MTTKWFQILLGIGIMLSFTSCCEEQSKTYVKKKPIYISPDKLQTTVYTSTGEKLKVPGRIYVKDKYLYINEYGKGIHVVDNSNPSEPKKVGFINIASNYNMAIVDNYMYVNNSADLVVLDISNPKEAKEVGRYPKSLGETYDADNIPANAIDYDPRKGVVIEWKDTLVVERKSCF